MWMADRITKCGWQIENFQKWEQGSLLNAIGCLPCWWLQIVSGSVLAGGVPKLCFSLENSAQGIYREFFFFF